jgi:PAS domain S-box-containing protein
MGKESSTIEQLQKSEEQLRRIFEKVPFGICVVGLDGRILQVNAALCRIVGYPKEEMLARIWGELGGDSDDFGISLKRLVQLVQDPGGCVEADKRYLHRDGSVVWGRINASLVRGDDNEPLHFVIHAEDITERKRTDAALHESEERFRIMADGCPTMMWVTNSEGGNQFVNRAFREFFGITYEEAEGGKWQALLHPDDAPEYVERLQRAVREHTTFKAEARVRRADGEWRWVGSYAEPRWSSSGKFLGHVGLSPDITERKQAEQALQFQDSLNRAIQEVSLDGILVVNQDGMIVSYNQRFLNVWQIPDPRIPGNPSITATSVPDKPILSANLDRVKDSETFLKRVRELYADPDATDQCEVELKDGRTLERHSTGLRSEHGQYLGRVWFFRDISERKQAERALRNSEEKFRQLAENSHEVFWMMSPAANEMLYVSPAYEQIWGRSCDSLYKAPLSWIEAIHPDDLEQAHLLFARQIQGEVLDSEYRIQTPDGAEKWIRDRAFPIRDQGGQLIRVVGIAEEITERKRHEAELATTNLALAASEARYRKLIDLSPNAVIVGRDHAIALANHAAIELFGVATAGDLIGRRFAGLVSPEARSGMEEIVQQLYEREMQLPLQEVQVLHSDGSLIDVELAASSFAENDEMAVQVVFRNITQRKQAEAEHARLIRGIEQVAESVVIIDLEGSILYVNPAFERITGYTRAEAIGNGSLMLKSDRHPAEFYQAMWATLLRGETWHGAHINKRKDGTLFTEEATISPIQNKDGKVINYVAVKRDVTQETLLRNQLNQAQKMEAVGRLAGGIAHDFNNLLMVIQTYTEMLQDCLPIQDRLRRNTEQVLKAAERGASLTGQMLAFSRKQVISPVVLDLNAVIDDTTKMLKRVIGEDIEFQVDLDEALWAIEADPDQLSQILMNLCVNSRDAMPQGGTLTIATANVVVGERDIVGHPCVSSGEYVRLSVADTGTGISKALQDHIFEPFFTTKEVGKGTGLGLATVYGIVKQSGGYVLVDSEPGQGACFTIYLPKVMRAVASRMSAQAKAHPRGSETLLVVEDEKFLREGICEFLRGLGYLVFAASSGEQALLIASEQEHIDLLLTDVVMPKMSGRELSQMLGSLRPALKTIHMSGYTDDAMLRHGIHESSATFLQKPFSLGTLARKVRDTLGRTEPER